MHHNLIQSHSIWINWNLNFLSFHFSLVCVLFLSLNSYVSTVIVSFEDDDDSEVEFLRADNNTIIVKSIAINLNEFS